MNKQNIKQQLRRAFFALAIVGALFTLPRAQADQPEPVSGSSTDCEHKGPRQRRLQRYS